MPPKAHAWVGPSSIARVLACPPSARFSEQFPETPSEYAAVGTEAHEYCEYLVRKALGEKVRNPKKKLKYYNAEMEECAQGYAAFIMELYETAKQTCPRAEILLEQRVDVSEYIPECFGTADCIIIADGQMTIGDYKHGMGIKVEATDNPQLKTYALGALAMFDFLYDIFCFGHAIFSAADFMENVLLLLGFKVIFLDDMMDSDDIRFRWYLKNKRDVSRNSFAKYAAKKKKPNPKKERIEKCTDEYIHSVEWYESRQSELFQEMLTFPDNFDMLEEEMQFCRRAIKNLRL